MNYKVTFRTKNGVGVSENFEAASRSALFAILNEKGITPISIEELGVKQPGTPKFSILKKHGFFILIALIICTLCTYFLFFNEEKPAETIKTTAKENVKKSPPKEQVAQSSKEKKVVPNDKPAPARNKAVKKDLGKPELSKENEFVKRPGALQLPDGTVLTFPPPKPGQPRMVHAYGRTYECDHEGNFRDITPRKLFHTAFEGNFLALAIEGRSFIPAFLTGLDEDDVRKMLTKPYKAIGDETDDELEQIKAYDEMRNAALDYMDQGGKFDDFVNEFAQFEKDRRQTQATCLREIMQLYKQGKIAEAKEMSKAANAVMQESGFKPMRLPAHVQKAFDELR